MYGKIIEAWKLCVKGSAPSLMICPVKKNIFLVYVREAEGGKDRDRAMREVGRACACMWLSPRMQAEEQLLGVSSLLLSHRRTVTLASAAGQHTPD